MCLQVRLVAPASLPPQLISSPPSRQSETRDRGGTLSAQQQEKTCQPAQLTAIRGELIMAGTENNISEHPALGGDLSYVATLQKQQTFTDHFIL